MRALFLIGGSIVVFCIFMICRNYYIEYNSIAESKGIIIEKQYIPNTQNIGIINNTNSVMSTVITGKEEQFIILIKILDNNEIKSYNNKELYINGNINDTINIIYSKNLILNHKE